MAEQTTLILIKPDAVQRGLSAEILARFERKGLQIVGMRFEQASAEVARQHYAVHADKPFFQSLIDFITAGPLVALALRGDEAVSVCRTIIGATDGRKAAPGTIRGDFGMSLSANLVHGSDSEENAQTELELWFNKGLVDWISCSSKWLDAD